MRTTHLVSLAIASLFTVGCSELIPDRGQSRASDEAEAFEWDYASEEPTEARETTRLDYTIEVEGPSGAEDEGQGKADKLNPAQFRKEVVEWINVVRAEGADCGEYGIMPPAAPMRGHGRLDAAAKRHSDDMAAHDQMSHEGSDGSRFWDRTQEAGYTGTPRGENVAVGYPIPEEVVRAWVESDGHCLVLMLPETNEIGVGYAFRDETRYGHFWTMVTGIR